MSNMRLEYRKSILSFLVGSDVATDVRADVRAHIYDFSPVRRTYVRSDVGPDGAADSIAYFASVAGADPRRTSLDTSLDFII